MSVDGNLVQVEDLKVYFPIKSGLVLDRHVGDIKAVDGVSFEIQRGETLGLVGESGCGKSTVGRAMLRLYEATAGKVIFDGSDISKLGESELRTLRRRMQMIFQDPYASLNPRHCGRAGSIGEPMRDARSRSAGARPMRASASCSRSSASPPTRRAATRTSSPAGSASASASPARSRSIPTSSSPTSRSPHSTSRSRRRSSTCSRTSSDEFDLTYLFIAHDLAVVRHISDRIAVMYLGTIVEISPADELYENPLHPYTITLLSAVPIPDPEVERQRRTILLPGDLPSPANPPPACRFHTRCPYVQPTRCKTDVPELRKLADGHLAACHWAEEIKAGRIEPQKVEPVFDPGVRAPEPELPPV